MNRVKDHEGDLWPVTGYQCSVCKWPLIPVNGSTAHPNCEAPHGASVVSERKS